MPVPRLKGGRYVFRLHQETYGFRRSCSAPEGSGDAGYSDDSVTDIPTSIAVKLLISLFRQGITDPAELTTELARSFGKPAKVQAIGLTLLHQYAISGVPHGYVHPEKTLYCLLPRQQGSQEAR
jgi:hypothetical protein